MWLYLVWKQYCNNTNVYLQLTMLNSIQFKRHSNEHFGNITVGVDDGVLELIWWARGSATDNIGWQPLQCIESQKMVNNTNSNLPEPWVLKLFVLFDQQPQIQKMFNPRRLKAHAHIWEAGASKYLLDWRLNLKWTEIWSLSNNKIEQCPNKCSSLYIAAIILSSKDTWN